MRHLALRGPFAALLAALAFAGACGGSDATSATGAGASDASGGGPASASSSSGHPATSSASTAQTTSASASGGGGAAPTGSGGAGGATVGATGGGGSSAGGGGLGGAGGAAPACTTDDDTCGPGFYCLAAGCGAGACVRQPDPTVDAGPRAEVCGCDAATYWNASLAAQKGVSVASQGACTTGAIACDRDTACPTGMTCNREVADASGCTPFATGACWVIPLECPQGTGGSGAGGDGAGGGDGITHGHACTNQVCETQCDLIASQNPWWTDATCD